MPYEHFSQVVDEIAKGAQKLCDSLRSGRRQLEQTASQLRGLQGGRVLDLTGQDQLNVRKIGRILLQEEAAEGVQAGGSIRQPSTASGRIGQWVGLGGRMAARAISSSAGAGAGAGTAAGAAGSIGTVASAIGIVVAVAAAGVLVVKALHHMAEKTREAASAALEAKRAFAEVSPAFVTIMTQKELLERREMRTRAQMMASTARAELESYRRWMDKTRNFEVMMNNLSSHLKIFWNNLKGTLMTPLEEFASWVNKQMGWTAQGTPTMPFFQGLSMLAEGRHPTGPGWLPRQVPTGPFNRPPHF